MAFWYPHYSQEVFVRTGPHLSSFKIRHTLNPFRGVFRNMTKFVIMFPISKVKEIRRANIMMIIKALEQPNVEMATLIQQQRIRYESK